MDTISYPFPNDFFDEEGYPTQESLDYIKNWAYDRTENKFGQYFGKGMYDELIEYLRNIWVYEDDAVGYEDGLLDLHTYGWSGNEDIVRVLKDTDLWTIKFRCKQTGGHYYFQIEEKGFNWRVEKVAVRTTVAEIIEESKVNKISSNTLLADSCPTCGHSHCLCRVPLGNFR